MSPFLNLGGDTPSDDSAVIARSGAINPESSRRTILVVDDDVAIRCLMDAFLKRSGFIVDLAADGETAIEKLRTTDYDAVITDLMMPRLDGFEVVRALEKEWPGLLRRTIVLTAYPGIVERVALNETCTIMSKPFDLKTLGALLQTLMSSEP